MPAKTVIVGELEFGSEIVPPVMVLVPLTKVIEAGCGVKPLVTVTVAPTNAAFAPLVPIGI